MNDRPIGMFDSGVGGLTVARSLLDRLPRERIIYVGDGARGPYGPRSLQEVRRFSRQIIDYLLGFGVKLVVIACNSATAAALEEAQREYDIPVVGVILPGVRAALRLRRSTVGVIGTRCTIESASYERAVHRLDSRTRVISRACPEFVEFVERGEVEGDHISEIAMDYLSPMMEEGMESLILGCTHYPLLRGLFAEIVGPDIPLINSAEETAVEVEDILERLGWLRNERSSGGFFFLTTGDAERSAELGKMFLGPEVNSVMRVALDFDSYPELDLSGGQGGPGGTWPDRRKA